MEKTSDIKEFWGNVLGYVKNYVSEQTFNTWFVPIKPIAVNDNTIYLEVPNKFFYEWIDTHFKDILDRAIKSVFGRTYKLNFTIILDENVEDVDSFNEKSYKKKKNYSSIATSGYFENFSRINEYYTFDNFVEGSSNQFAKAASIAVANSPGKNSFNPLVIYGGTGLGKTHLLQAIGNEVLSNNRVKKVVYISSDAFTLDFITAVQKNKVNEFSQHYRSVDLLLLDDIQFFQNKEQTQEQFFHIFNDLYHHGKQIVLTSDRQPSELDGLHDRMLSRFQSGLVVDIQPPDLETRIAILQKKAEEDGLEISFEVIEYIATNIKSNVRELEGALIRLLAYSSLLRVDIDMELTKRVLQEILGSKINTSISIEQIQNIVCSVYNVTLDSLIGKIRTKEVAEARMIAMYLTREYTDLSLKTIGLYFGGRDHSTVVHAIKWVENNIKRDKNFAHRILSFRNKLESSI
ncbi:MAG: chromosomal replication initiator protein DnaA [Candidatus Marinimicrobia bacterium]|nr:chromosomal replication initiator protein DnaA [Candidatus Neomarinimicrobiota bacterium]